MDELWGPAIAMVLSIGGPVLIVILIVVNRHRLAMQKYERIQQLLDSGKDPDEVERMIEIIEKLKTLEEQLRSDAEVQDMVDARLNALAYRESAQALVEADSALALAARKMCFKA